MPVQTVSEGKHPHERQQPREQRERRAEGHQPPAVEELEPQQHIHRLLFRAQAKLVVDEHDELVMVQLLDPISDQVVEELRADDLEASGYHGILVDVET